MFARILAGFLLAIFSGLAGCGKIWGPMALDHPCEFQLEIKEAGEDLGWKYAHSGLRQITSWRLDPRGALVGFNPHAPVYTYSTYVRGVDLRVSAPYGVDLHSVTYHRVIAGAGNALYATEVFCRLDSRNSRQYVSERSSGSVTIVAEVQFILYPGRDADWPREPALDQDLPDNMRRRFLVARVERRDRPKDRYPAYN